MFLQSTYQAPDDDKGGAGGGGVKDPADAAAGKDDDVKKPEDKGDIVNKDAKSDIVDDKATDDKKKGIFLPKGRVDEMVGRERAKTVAAEDRARRLEAELATSRKTADNEIENIEKQFDTLEEQYTDAIADGEKSKALELRKKMRTLQDKLIDARTDVKALAAKEGAKEEFAYNQVLGRLEEEYDVLNPDHDDFDKDLADDMADYIFAKRSKGMSGATALQAAVKRFLPDLKEGDGDKARDDRGRFAREKAADAAKKQPADLRSAGKDHDKAGGGLNGKNIMQMSQDEFANLPDEEKAKMRGDTL